MNPGRAARRAVTFVTRNWPLKLAAIVVAALLYAGLVVSQGSASVQGPIRITVVNQPGGTVLINQLRDIDEIRYVAPADAGRLRLEDFRATIDLTDVQTTGTPVTVQVNVEPLDPRVTVVEVRPRAVQVILDTSVRKVVAVRVDEGTVPAGVQAGDPIVDPKTVTVSGPSTVVKSVVEVRASVRLDQSGVNVDRMVNPDPVDDQGQVVTGVNVDPATVHVQVPLFTNRQSRSLPVNPTVTGTPAQGFRIASISTNPLVVSLEGNLDALAALVRADTEPVQVSGATSDVNVVVGLSLPTGVVPLGIGTVAVSVRIEPVTDTRTYGAGLRLDGRQPGLDYEIAPNHVLLTLFGSVADLDRLGSAPLVVALNVAALGPGKHDVPVVPSLPSGVTIAALSPETVTVTIRVPATPTPAPASPSASPSPGAS